MTLAIGAFAFTSVEAHDCNKKTAKTTRHTTTKTNRTVATNAVKPKATVVAQSQVCRVVPFKACKISADHKTVTCYETMDLNNLTPLNGDVTYYGPTGDTPGKVEKQTVPTTVVKGAPRHDYCRRDNQKRETTCYYKSNGIVRNSNGTYAYTK